MSTDIKTIQAYNDHASEYDAHVSDPNDSIYHAYYEKPAIRAALPSLKNKKILSIGCGSGVETPWFFEQGAAKVVGVDISEELIKIAKKKFPTTEFKVMDMTKLDFPDESFDVIYSSLAVHYLPDWGSLLMGAKRILQPGGHFVFSCVHPIASGMEYSHDDQFNWALLGRKNHKESDEKTLFGDYLATENDSVRKYIMPIGDMEVTVYRRTLEKMVTDFRSVGLQIEGVFEPKPSDEMKALNLSTHQRLIRVPEFIVWRLRK